MRPGSATAELEVLRIGFSGAACLKGTGFGYFAAFLSRSYREHDYLLGRLHAADRLIDIVCDAAGGDSLPAGIDVIGLKKRVFAAIVDAEAPKLTASHALIRALSSAIGGLGR
jgi:hypothetical protein